MREEVRTTQAKEMEMEKGKKWGKDARFWCTQCNKFKSPINFDMSGIECEPHIQQIPQCRDCRNQNKV